MEKPILTNIVTKDVMQDIQRRTLEILKEAVSCSYGPHASTTAITSSMNGEAATLLKTNYSKDGVTILQSIMFQDVIELSTKDMLVDVCKNIDMKVGDGTTSAVILSTEVFKALTSTDEFKNVPPYQLVNAIKEAAKMITEDILKHKIDCTPELIEKIALISTNGNEEVAANLKNIYEEHGNDVHIEVGISPSEYSMTRVYDGMTLETGYADNCFVNTPSGKAVLHNPSIYIFEDPIDTEQMAGYFDAILKNNILLPLETGKQEDVVPTVIFAPMISRDLSAYMKSISEHFHKIAPAHRPPLLIVTNIYEAAKFADIASLCGAKSITKYIDKNLYKADVEKGLAPTIETVHTFGGKADMVDSSTVSTTIVNPALMYDENGEYTDTFNSLLSFLETSLSEVKESTQDVRERYELKKRIQSLKANLVEYLVGGLTPAERDAQRDLVQDAVRCCMSAAKDGVGNGASFEGLRSTISLCNTSDTSLTTKVLIKISDAYIETVRHLYRNSGIVEADINKRIEESLLMGGPINLLTGTADGDVLTSIMTEPYILEGISKLISLLISTNQFICPDIMYNRYNTKNIKVLD